MPFPPAFIDLHGANIFCDMAAPWLGQAGWLVGSIVETGSQAGVEGVAGPVSCVLQKMYKMIKNDHFVKHGLQVWPWPDL